MNELDCQTALPALHRYVDGECPPAERTALEVHLAACAECRTTLRALRREAELLSTASGRGEPPADLYDRVAAGLPSRRAMFFIRHRRALVAAAAVLVVAVVAIAAAGRLGGDAAPVAVVYARGEPEVRVPSSGQWQVVSGERELEPGSVLRAPAGRAASLEFEDWTQLTLGRGSRMVVGGHRRGVVHRWRIERGELWAIFGQGRFRVDTPVGSVEGAGCQLLVSVTGAAAGGELSFWGGFGLLPSAHADEAAATCRATVTVVWGAARVWNRHGSVELRSGMQTVLEPGRAPAARPADLATALAWVTDPRDPQAPVALAAPSAQVEEVGEPTPVEPPPFEEIIVEEPAVVPRHIRRPAPEAPPIVAPELEGPEPGPPTDVNAQALLGGTVAVTWQAPREGAPAAAYKVWRKAEGDERYKQITIPPLAAGAAGARLSYYDHDIARGRKYAYRVSAVDPVGRDGKLSEPVRATACEFEVTYTGGNIEFAVISVTRRVRDSWVRHRFIVHKRDPAKGHSGAIGAPVRKRLRDGAQTVDFATGFRLVDIVKARHPGTGQMSFKLVIEDKQGRRSELSQPVTRTNGQ